MTGLVSRLLATRCLQLSKVKSSQVNSNVAFGILLQTIYFNNRFRSIYQLPASSPGFASDSAAGAVVPFAADSSLSAGATAGVAAGTAGAGASPAAGFMLKSLTYNTLIVIALR